MDLDRLTMLSRWLACACACALAAACDTQASTGYRGEPLLSVTGSVVLTRSRVEGPLVPAIAFVNEQSEVHFLDVEVQGEFPSSFTFHVYEPPPESAFMDDRAEPRWAVGYIAVVATDHVPSVQTGLHTGGLSRCTPDDVCRVEESWCTRNGQECYSETTVCKHATSLMPDCTTDSTGSEELTRDVFSQFEGFSLAYQILYLEAPADGLAAGYHLFHFSTVEEPTPQMQRAALDTCKASIREGAVELYNAANDTDLTVEEVYESDDVSEETLEAVRAFEAAATPGAYCPKATDVVERIEDPLSEPISVVIGPDLEPQ